MTVGNVPIELQNKQAWPRYLDKICVYDEHPIAGQDIQPFDKINK